MTNPVWANQAHDMVNTMPLSRFKLVLIDLDETLLDFKRAETDALRRSFEDFSLPYSAAAEAVFKARNAELWKALERGETTQSELRAERFRRMLAELGWDADPVALGEAYVKRLSECSYPLPGAVDACAYLAGRYKLVALTNGIADVQRPRLANSALAPYIADIAVSEEAGANKPSPAAFEYACALAGVRDRDAVIMVGDSLESDIRGAFNYGIASCWYNPAGAPNGSGLRPDFELRSLGDIAAVL